MSGDLINRAVAQFHSLSVRADSSTERVKQYAKVVWLIAALLLWLTQWAIAKPGGTTAKISFEDASSEDNEVIGHKQIAAIAAGEAVNRVYQRTIKQEQEEMLSPDSGNQLQSDAADGEHQRRSRVNKVNILDSYVVQSYQTPFHISKKEVLSQRHTPAGQTDLSLVCMDCMPQSIISMQSMMTHSQGHIVSCQQCSEFRPDNHCILVSRCNMLEAHTSSQCRAYRGEILPAPLFDEELSLSRFVFRFGSPKTLFEFFPEFSEAEIAKQIKQVDRAGRTLLHDLFQYTTGAVLLAFLKRFNSVVKVEDLKIQDAYGWSPLHYLFRTQSESTITQVASLLGKKIDLESLSLQNSDGSHPLHILFHRSFDTNIAFFCRQRVMELNHDVLELQDPYGVNLLHILFSSRDCKLTSDFIARQICQITEKALTALTNQGETPLHKLFKTGSFAAVERLLDNCKDSIPHAEMRRCSEDGNTPLHSLFSRGSRVLTSKILDLYPQNFDSLLKITNKERISVFETLVKNNKPAWVSDWIHEKIPFKRKWLEEKFLTKPSISWCELIQLATEQNMISEFLQLRRIRDMRYSYKATAGVNTAPRVSSDVSPKPVSLIPHSVQRKRLQITAEQNQKKKQRLRELQPDPFRTLTDTAVENTTVESTSATSNCLCGEYNINCIKTKQILDQILKYTEDKVLVFCFSDDKQQDSVKLKELIRKNAHMLSEMASVYYVHIDRIPIYQRYFDITILPSTVFFFNGQHLKVDWMTGDHTKFVGVFKSSQDFIDTVESLYRGAMKGKLIIDCPIAPENVPKFELLYKGY